MTKYYHDFDDADACTSCGFVTIDPENNLDECPTPLLEIFRDLSIELAFPLEQRKNIEKRLRAATAMLVAQVAPDKSTTMLDLGDARVKIAVPKKPRIYWNNAALEEYSLKNPDIRKYREERWAKPSVRLEVD